MDPIQPQNQPLTPQPGNNSVPPPQPPMEPEFPPAPPVSAAPVDTLGGDPMLAGVQAPQPSNFQTPAVPQTPDLPPTPETFSPQPIQQAPVDPGLPPIPPTPGTEPFPPSPGVVASTDPAAQVFPDQPTNNPQAMPSMAGIPDAPHQTSGGGSKKVLGIFIVIFGVLALLGIIGIVITSL